MVCSLVRTMAEVKVLRKQNNRLPIKSHMGGFLFEARGQMYMPPLSRQRKDYWA